MRIVWTQSSDDRELDQAVLYSQGEAVPWDGLFSFDEGRMLESGPGVFFDGGVQYAQIAAYTYPDLFASCNERIRLPFGLTYRTLQGDDEEIHLVYGASVVDSNRPLRTVAPERPSTLFQWNLEVTPVILENTAPSLQLVLVNPGASLTDILYGTDGSDPRLPTPSEVISLFAE